MYTIGEVSKMFGLPVSTLRYYDKEGLFPHLKKDASGIRKFDNDTLEALRVIECLKKSGMEIKDIKTFMEWCSEGPVTYEQRYEMFKKQKESVEAKIKRLENTLDMIHFKLWYYSEAIKTGNEEELKAMIPDGLPKEVAEFYVNSHK